MDSVVDLAYPRLSRGQALEGLARLIQAPASELAMQASSELEGASFYPLANGRISQADLQGLRSKIVQVAESHGFPKPQTPTARRAFDQALGAVLHREMGILTAEAADEGVWSFLSLRLCPDVSFWRYPGTRGTEVSDAEIDRFLGGNRHVFGRLWWRVEVLGSELSSRLLEDEAVGLMERPTIGGYPLLARAIASTQLEVVERIEGAKRQDVFRDALKRIRREMGFINVYMLESSEIAQLVERLFDDAAMAIAHVAPEEREWEPLPEFEAACGRLWPSVQALIEVPRWGEVLMLREEAARYLVEDPYKALQATKIASDLGVLLDSWHDLGRDERSIVVAAIRYFLLETDSAPDSTDGGLDDDEAVVAAAYKALRLELSFTERGSGD